VDALWQTYWLRITKKSGDVRRENTQSLSKHRADCQRQPVFLNIMFVFIHAGKLNIDLLFDWATDWLIERLSWSVHESLAPSQWNGCSVDHITWRSQLYCHWYSQPSTCRERQNGRHLSGLVITTRRCTVRWPLWHAALRKHFRWWKVLDNMRRMDRWSLWSLFDLSRSTFDEDRRENYF